MHYGRISVLVAAIPYGPIHLRPVNRHRCVRALPCVSPRPKLWKTREYNYPLFFFQHTFPDNSRILSNGSLFDGNATAYGALPFRLKLETSN